MNMNVDFREHRELIQGSPEWLALREGKRCSSETGAVMACHPNLGRDALLEQKATLTKQEFSVFVQTKVLDKGHRIEAMVREHVENDTMEDLFQTTCTNGSWLASFDGLSMDRDFAIEVKQWNLEYAPGVQQGKIPLHYAVQMEVQMKACPTLPFVRFIMSDGTKDNWVQWDYCRAPGLIDRIEEAWEQFERDLAVWKPVEKVVRPVAVRPADLPAINVEVRGELVTIDNIADFRAGAERAISGIKKELETDEDFINAEEAVKWLEGVEKRIDVIVEQVTAKAGIEAVVHQLRDIQQNLARSTRLQLARQIKADKENRRDRLVARGINEVGEYVVAINEEFSRAGVHVQSAESGVDFYSAIKNKRTYDTLVAAINDEIARGKIAVERIAKRLRENLKQLDAVPTEYSSLFRDRSSLARLEPDHLQLRIEADIAAHQAALEKAKREKEELQRAMQEQRSAAQAAAMEPATEELPLTHDLDPEPVTSPAVESGPFSQTPVAPVNKARPTTREIMSVLALHFRVHEVQVGWWLLDMGSEEIEDAMEESSL
jgi:predicted phage-related endonuclease